MEHAEAMARIEQLKREREALEGSYADLMRELEETGVIPEEDRPREMMMLVARLVNYINIERQQFQTLYELLLDAYTRLAFDP